MSLFVIVIGYHVPLSEAIAIIVQFLLMNSMKIILAVLINYLIILSCFDELGPGLCQRAIR